MSEDIPMIVVRDPTAVAAPDHDFQPDFDPALIQIVPYLRYDATGRITGSGQMGRGFIQAERIRSTTGGIMEGVGFEASHYVERASGTPTVAERTTLPGLPSALTARVMEEALIPGLPPCTIRFSGPINGEQPHEGGDCLIGFMAPGTYTLDAEPFPYRAIRLTLTVTE